MGIILKTDFLFVLLSIESIGEIDMRINHAS